MSASTQPPPPPSVGTRVELQGLVGRKDLNERKGVVTQPYDETTGRVGVHVFGNHKTEGVSIKPANLKEHPQTYLEGLQVKDSGDPTLGRIALASKDFEPGDTVLAEPPIFTFDAETGYTGMMDTYLNSSLEVREAILEMHCPAMPSDTVSPLDPMEAHQTRQRLKMLEVEWKAYVYRKPSCEKTLTLQTAKKLLRIIDVNAHSYSVETTGDLVVTESTMPKTHHTALFALGSKVEHSCAPNLSYASEHGKLEYLATRPIAKGDRVSISYQTLPLEHPRSQRRDFLLANKDFLCHCERCLGPDECNPCHVECKNCKSRSIAIFDGKEEQWKCISCQAVFEAIHRDIRQHQDLESYFSQEIQRSEYYLQTGSFDDTSIPRVVALQKEMAEKLHPLHWLHVKGYRHLSSWAASFARMFMQRGHHPESSSVRTHLYLSAMALLSEAQWIQRNGAIVYKDMSLKAAGDIVNDTKNSLFSETPSLKDAQRLLDDLCQRGNQNIVDMAHSIFQAGLDLLLAGHGKQVARLYKTFTPIFDRWKRMSDNNRERVQILVQSHGTTNKFQNHLLF